MLSVGRSAGSWLVEDLLCLGIPSIYRVRHSETGAVAHLKALPHTRSSKECQLREISALSHVVHPNLPGLLDFGICHDTNVVWTVFRMFEGEALSDRLQQAPLSWQEACHVFREIADALVTMHGSGLVHRDLRPSNLLIGQNGAVQLAGFDFAMLESALEQSSEVAMGDIAYLAPEVLQNPSLHGAKADTYALGCVLYEALTGTLPFRAAAFGDRRGTAARMFEWKTRSAPLDPGPECPSWLRNLVTKATQPDPDQRLPDISAMVGWLDGARLHWEQPPSAPSPQLPPPGLLPLSPSICMTQPLRPRRPVRVPPKPAPTPFPFVQCLAAASGGCVAAMAFSTFLVALLELGGGR